MKKALFILFALISITTQAQVANGTETKQNAFRSMSPQTATTVNYLTTMGTDGTMGRVTPVNVTIPTVPLNYTVLTPTLGAHLSGIDTRLGQISSTTAGLTQRIYFTADDTTVNSVVYFASNSTGKGATAAGSPPNLVLADNTKGYFTKDLISIPQPAPTIGYAGSYSGNLSVSATPTPVATRQRFTIEVYRTNNLGTPIASGVSGAPVGDLGVTVIAILDSGELNINAGAITNVAVNGILTQNITINTGERLRYHVSAAKIGAGGGNVTFGVYYGSSYNSYYDVPVAITTDAVINKSTVVGVTDTDALNTLNTLKANDSNVVHKTGNITESIDGEKTFNSNITAPTYNGYVPLDEANTEGARLNFANTSTMCWGDSLTHGDGATGGLTYETVLTSISGFAFSNQGVGGESSTQIKNRMVADVANYSKPLIIWAGRNNFTAPTTVKADIATMISTAGHSNYLVLSILNGAGEGIGTTPYNQITSLNNDLKAIYGDKYVDVRGMLISNYNPSIPQDVTDFNNDIPPTSLRFDNIHLNNAGYTLVGELLNKKLGTLYNKEAYLQSKDMRYYTGIDIYPLANNDYSLGNVDFRYQEVWSDSFRSYGNALYQSGGLTDYISSTGFRWQVGIGGVGRIFSDGNWLIGGTITNAGYKLDVIGTTRLNSTLYLGTLPTTSAGNYDILTRDTTTGETQQIDSSSIYRLRVYTVATLPAGTQGDMAYVTDATSPTYLGALTGGGSVVCPVFYNGTAWVSH